jgi:hypothetical protein
MARALTRPAAASAALTFLLALPLFAAPTARPLSALYPKLDPATLKSARSPGGYSAQAEGAPLLLPNGEAGAAIARTLEGKKSSFLVETLSLIPGYEAGSKLELFNSMTRFRSLSGVTYASKSKGKGTVLFSDVTRISDPRKAASFPDEAAASLPERATFYIRLKDVNFGPSYYKAELDTRAPGIVFALSNVRPLSYFLMPVVAEGGFFCIFYVEPVQEGLLVYGVSGGVVSSAVAKHVNIRSAVRKRTTAIAGWLASGNPR